MKVCINLQVRVKEHTSCLKVRKEKKAPKVYAWSNQRAQNTHDTHVGRV